MGALSPGESRLGQAFKDDVFDPVGCAVFLFDRLVTVFVYGILIRLD